MAIRDDLRHWLPLPAALAAGAAVWWLRHGFVEREGLAVACLDGGGGWVCAVREATEAAMGLAPFHAAALVAGLVVLFAWGPLRRVGIWIAVSAGPAGLALGHAAVGGTGLLLGLIALATRGPAQPEAGGGEQQGDGRPAQRL
jgi:hypothetical protein